jgi:ribosome biogenesis GTPase
LAEPAGSQPGLVVAGHGRRCLVESDDGRRVLCHSRGKKGTAVVGDRVLWRVSGDEGLIEKVEPRRNLFYRQDEVRTKSFAANLDQVLLLVAAEPEFSESQLARALIAAEAERITPLIALNKSDLVEPYERAWARLLPYQHMGYGVLPLSLRLSGDVDREHLLNHLRGRSTLVLGPSGAGKSTLINLLVPAANALTNEISQALGSGKHTTTATTWYWVDPERRTGLIDSPGFQEFGLHHIEPMQLASLMPDLRPHIAGCKFYNCTHLHEPACSVRAAIGNGPDRIQPSRHRIYADLFQELSAPRY